MFFLHVDAQIILRQLEQKDADTLFQLIDKSREYLREWLPWVDDTKTVNDSVSFIKDTIIAFENGIGLTTGIFYKNQLVGMIGFNVIDGRNKIAYIGYWLAPHYQGKGIITKSTRALINYGFFNLNLNRVDIRVAYENRKSRSIPERLGFKREGKIRQAEWLYDHFVDHIIYGILKEEWQNG